MWIHTDNQYLEYNISKLIHVVNFHIKYLSASKATIESCLIWNKYGTLYKDTCISCANFNLLFHITEWCGHFEGIYWYICGHLPKFDWFGIWTSDRRVTMFFC